MSRNRKLVKVIRKIYQSLYCFYTKLKKQFVWLLRTFLVTKNKSRYRTANAGFVLPTVVMVSLVVVLLTLTILFRSFERSKNANNVRINEVTMNAASPAVERARAKIKQLFQDPRLPRTTPSDLSLTQVIDSNASQFTFGDEIPLKLKITNKLKTDLKINSALNTDEAEANTAWKYPVDTDNNGKFDSYTLYGLYYRTPNNSVRGRTPIEARAQPMDEGTSGNQCDSKIATSANLVGTQGWFKVGSKLKRSLFVYTTIIPIDDLMGIPTSKSEQYETYKGNKGFVALEYQQDRERIPINNNAVLYEDDLEIAPGAGLNINGRIFTNGNLLTRQDAVRYYLVSSDKSCYFSEENSKIVVAGNLINSKANEDYSGGSPRVDKFNKPYGDQNDKITDDNKTVDKGTYGKLAAYNEEAYARRINRLVTATVALYPNESQKNQLPTEVQKEIDRDMAADKTLAYTKALDDQLRIYFRRRTRRVPYKEVPFNTDALKSYATTSPLLGSGDTLRPIDAWVFPFDPSDTTKETGFAEIAINKNGAEKIRLEATDPEVQIESGKEDKLGDRILVGNNLPQYWFDTTKGKFVSSPDEGQEITGKKWDAGSSKIRKRFSQAYQLDNLGITDRDDFWEKSAAQKPQGLLDIVGGMRVVTGGGIYLPSSITKANAATTLPGISTPTSPVSVWSDSMPMGVDVSTNTAPQGLPTATTPYLRMRATVVYHYQKSTYDSEKPDIYQTPIACVSSYYDPTNATTAKNEVGLPDIRLRDTRLPSANRALKGLTTVATTDTGGLSNNGVVYPATSLSGYDSALKYQANLKYPSGRPVNEQLQKAMQQQAASKKLTLAQQSAIDSAICALKIFDGTLKPTDATDDIIPHGAISEISFLDARQIKAIDKLTSTSSQTYDLDVELRQPLEIRTTVIDLDLLRRKPITGNVNSGSDFLLPNSGIIYATREDALADASNPDDKDVSATDFRLDPNRRPNGIMLINGSDLSRNSTYKPEEKGLIVASNLPVYIRGHQTDLTKNQGYFNRHTEEEFTGILLKDSTDWTKTFYARTELNPNFACRNGQFSGCNPGESWRPASVIADSITVLSHNFKLGFRQDGDYDLRDNYGNYPVGYDVDGVASINPATPVTLNEAVLKMDLDGDGNMSNTNVTAWDETKLKTDIDGDGKTDKTSIPINESNITATVVARLNGFWDNNFVTSRNFLDSDYSSNARSANPVDSSYFNNFVTPIQRRVNYSEYIMEICPKATVTTCTPNDWVVGYDVDGNGNLNGNVTIDGVTILEKDIKANQLVKALKTATPPVTSIQTNRLRAGTTATPAIDPSDPAIQRYPRRIAFLRHRTGQTVTKVGTPITGNSNTLVLDTGMPVPLGIFANGSNLEVKYFPYFNPLTIDSVAYAVYSNSNKPRTLANTLWFKGRNAGSADYDPQNPLWIENSLTGNLPTEQPLLVPVLQIQFPFTQTIDPNTLSDSQNVKDNVNNWLQIAAQTETNLAFVQGNTPGRPVETNGGLENFVRYLENWQNIKHMASGAFIQFKRSSYATAPWQLMTADHKTDSTAYTTSSTGTLFGYPQGYRITVTNANGKNMGRTAFYAPPNRFWGYDVALLTQLPDLFSQRFTTPSVAEPNEFFREVGRDDAWVKTLLCAAEDSNITSAGYDSASDVGTGFKYAISKEQRPNACK